MILNSARTLLQTVSTTHHKHAANSLGRFDWRLKSACYNQVANAVVLWWKLGEYNDAGHIMQFVIFIWQREVYLRTGNSGSANSAIWIRTNLNHGCCRSSQKLGALRSRTVFDFLVANMDDIDVYSRVVRWIPSEYSLSQYPRYGMMRRYHKCLLKRMFSKIMKRRRLFWNERRWMLISILRQNYGAIRDNVVISMPAVFASFSGANDLPMAHGHNYIVPNKDHTAF